MNIAFIFPGQGSQKLGMLKQLAGEHKLVKQTFEQASDVLSLDLERIVNEDEKMLGQTAYTQPIILAASIAMWRVWQDLGGHKPAMMAGHSLGEYSALVAAGALSFEDAVALVHARGNFMQQAVAEGEGAMAAVLGLSDAQVLEVCQQVKGIVTAVNFNAPGQVVIAGEKVSVEQAARQAKDQGAKRVALLPVSVPSHCQLMRPAARQLGELLAQTVISQPQIDVIHNVDVRPHSDSKDIIAALTAQLYSPVRWVETIEYIVANQITNFVECGPGRVLAGLNRRINKNTTCQGFDDLAGCQQLISNFAT